MSFKRLGRQKGNDYPAGLSAAKYGNYQVTKSLRFRRANSAYLNRTQSSGNRKTWTWSGWIKRGLLKTQQTLFSAATWDGTYNRYMQVTWDYTTDSIDYLQFDSSTGSVEYRLTTTPVYTDPAAWYHVVCVFDSTQSTSTNRMKIYVNGTQVTAFSTSSYPTLNFDGAMNYSSRTAYIGALMYNGSMTNFMDGLMTEIVFVDGQALTPSSFGATDFTTGQWQPVAYTGTYGTNGYYLPFTDTTSTFTLGNDAGNGNNWTLNNFSLTAGVTYDSMTDVPTLTSGTAANYCTFNPLYIPLGGVTYYSLSNANQKITGTSSSNSGGSIGTIATEKGKYYYEFTMTGVDGSGYCAVGACDISQLVKSTTYTYLGYQSTSYGYYASGSKVSGDKSSSYGSSFTTNDIIGVALDCDNGAIYFSKNGTWQNGGDPTSGANRTGAAFAWTGGSQRMIPQVEVYRTGSIADANFGQRTFTYTAPTGYTTLNSYNLPDPTIKQPNKQFDVSLWNGTKQPQNITNSGFQPDAVWIKSRSYAYDHNFWNSITGNSRFLIPNKTNAEVSTITDALMSFNSNGFSVGSDINGIVNDAAPTKTYVAWQWQAGKGTSSTNTDGSISSTVSVNKTSGFSIVSHSGTGSNSLLTVGHGLNANPAFMLMKGRQAGAVGTDAWVVYHSSFSAGDYMHLNSTNAKGTSSNYWGNTLPTSSVFYVSGTSTQVGNESGVSYITYAWSEVPGYSSFGSYTGNGSSDGTFVHTGFKPKFLLFKSSSNAGNNWVIYDSARNTYNVVGASLCSDSNSAENGVSLSNENTVDFLSNGFKFRTANALSNYSGYTYIYAAFAEYPFKNGNAAIYNIN